MERRVACVRTGEQQVLRWRTALHGRKAGHCLGSIHDESHARSWSLDLVLLDGHHDPRNARLDPDRVVIRVAHCDIHFDGVRAFHGGIDLC